MVVEISLSVIDQVDGHGYGHATHAEGENIHVLRQLLFPYTEIHLGRETSRQAVVAERNHHGGIGGLDIGAWNIPRLLKAPFDALAQPVVG